MTPHSVAHLFECPMHQTDLTSVDLWLWPKKVTWVPQRLTWARWRAGYNNNNNINMLCHLLLLCCSIR